MIPTFPSLSDTPYKPDLFLSTATRSRPADLGSDLLPAMEHWVWLVRKVKRPALLQTLIVQIHPEAKPELEHLIKPTATALPPTTRRMLFQLVARYSPTVLARLEQAAERIALLDDDYGAQAVHSLLNSTRPDEAALLAPTVGKASRALYLYLQQEYPTQDQPLDRRFDQAEQLQLMHRQWKSEQFSSHYHAPKGVIPTWDAATEAALCGRILALYPHLSENDILIDYFTRQGQGNSVEGGRETQGVHKGTLYTLTVTFNGSETHYQKVESGEVICHEDVAALSVRYSWNANEGMLGVFSEDKEHRRALAMIFRDVVLACQDEFHTLPLRQFDLSGFLQPAMLERLANERLEGVERISLLQLKVARPFAQQLALPTTEALRHTLASYLTITRDRRDTRDLYTIAREDHGLEKLTGYTVIQVQLVIELAKQAHRKAHKVAVQITVPNGFNDKSKTEDERKRVMAQLAHLHLLREF